MNGHKYYFKKPKSEIAKDILMGLVVSGGFFIAATSPYFIRNILENFSRRKKYSKKKFYDTFYRLKKDGCLNIQKSNHKIHISLTEKGRKKAGRFQIDSLKINKPQKWDKKWRIVIFDIVQLQSVKRNAFRGKLQELGFLPLQKSIWICPYKCNDEIGLLRDFFGLTKKEIRLITAENIEEDKFLKKKFSIS